MIMPMEEMNFWLFILLSGIWLFQCHRFVMLVVSENTFKRISTCVLFGAQGCMIAVNAK